MFLHARSLRPARLAAVFALVLALPLWAAPLAGQDGSLRGVVVDPAGEPIAGAEVSAEGGAASVRTADDGTFVLPAPPGAAELRLRVDRLGYAPASPIVAATGGEPLRIVLDPRPILMQGLTAIGSPGELAEVRARMRQIPGAVALIDEGDLERTRRTNLEDVLRFVPGVYAQSRSGAADESQFSIRGSGLRNNFHLRGVNVLVNGMPYRQADGFTDFESLELLTTSSIQVYKGANALRFGGSTLGGAINLETKTGHTAEPLQVFAQGGSFDYFKGQVSSGMVFDGANYYASYARTDVGGYRAHATQRRDRLNGHLGLALTPSLELRGFWFYAHVEEELPGSLTRDELADPEAAAAANVENDWGRDYDLHHLGIQLRAQLSPEQRLEIAPYFQHRDIVHPIFRVLDQVSRDVGLEARYENTAGVGERQNRLVLGIQPAYGNVDNRHYENLGGESGDLARDQRDEAGSVALYLEDVLAITPRVSAVAGFRYDRSRRSVDDSFLSDGDQSDERIFEAAMPKIGFLYELAGVDGQIFGNASRMYEPPLLLELNSLTVPGFVDLDAQDAWQFELGTRGRAGPWRWQLSAYDMEISDEIVNANVQPFPGAPFTVPTYRNVDETRHVGIEAGLELAMPVTALSWGGETAGMRLAYTFSRFTFESDRDHEGNEIPGAPSHVVQLELEYGHPSGISIAPSMEWVPGDFFVDSGNTVTSDGWLAIGLRGEWSLADLGATAFLEARNLTDALYSPTVSVDDAAGRYYQPADGRSLYVGVRWHP